MDLNEYRVDPEKEKDGVWLPFGRNADGSVTEFLLARIGNPNYRRRMRAVMKPYRRQINRGTLDDKLADQLHAEVLADSVILGWKHLQESGKEVPYSRQKCIDLLVGFPELKEDIVDAASDLDTFLEDMNREDESGETVEGKSVSSLADSSNSQANKEAIA